MPAQDARAAARRAQLAGRIADILLARGVATLPLRDLAALLNTSDRMLLYYFGTQAGLVSAVLSIISERLARDLEQALPPGPLPPAALLKRLSSVMARPAIAAPLRVWADVTARGARGEAPFHAISRTAVINWRDWTAARLDIAGDARRDMAAAAILAAIEGARAIELAAPGMTKGVTQLLARAFD